MNLPTHDSGTPEQLLTFLRAAEALKDQTRTSWTSAGRRESVADHSWRLCLMALIFRPKYPAVDFARLVKICIIHDLGEAIAGDISAVVQAERQGAARAGTSTAASTKAASERADLLQLLTPLPDALRLEIVGLWDEYEAAVTPEARLAKGLDKLETILQHNQGANPNGFDYRFNLGYGRQFTNGDAVLEAVRALLDAETEARAAASD